MKAMDAEAKAKAKAEAKLKRKLQDEKWYSWRRILRIVIPIVVIALLVFIILSVAFGNPNDLKFSDDGMVCSDAQAPDTSKGIKGQLPSDSGMTMFAENDYLKLGFSPKDDLFIIIDKATGRVFRSYPEPLPEGETDANGNEIASDIASYSKKTETGQILRSPVFVEYTKSGMEGGFTKGVNQLEHIKTVYFIKDGVQLVYDVKELELTFTVEITLDGDSLKYKVPKNAIIERATLEGEEEDRRPMLAALSILPYLGAHRNGDSGYFVSPDGSGALTYFDVARVSNFNEYCKRIYGYDYTFDSIDSPDYSNEKITMPVYGIVDDDYMLTSFIDCGESNAELMIGNPGVKNLTFYNIYFQFTYRYFYRMQISKSGSLFDMVIKDTQLGDVVQHVYFNTDPSFNPAEKETAYTYVDVATKTRGLLLDKWSAQWNVNKQQLSEASSPMSIKFFMGAETVSGGVLNQLKVMTTFDDVREMYEDLESIGVSDLKLTLLGWTNHGYYWNTTTKNKPDGDYGGKSGLRDLNAWAKKKNIELSLDNNLLIIYGSPNGWYGATQRNSVVKKPNTFYLNYYMDTTYGRLMNKGYYMSPVYFKNELLDDEIERLSDYGTQNVTLQQVGDLVYTDYNEKNALLRLQTIKMYVDVINKYKQNFSDVSVYYGYDYAVAVSDVIDNIPMSKSRSILLDEQIPFIQIVYHGLAEYYSAAINNQDSNRYALLKSIEYGSNITYEVTREKSSLLQYTDYVFLFKAQYSLLRDEIAENYRIAEEAIKPFSTQNIVNHFRVTANQDVFCTEYSGGAKVYVNYTNSDYTLANGSKVPAMGYLVVNA